MTEELLKQLIDMIANTAPELWRIAMRQALIVGIKNMAWFALASIGAIVSIKALLWGFVHWNDDHGAQYTAATFAIPAGIVFGALSLVAVIVALSEGINYLANPEYYAIRILLELVK